MPFRPTNASQLVSTVQNDDWVVSTAIDDGDRTTKSSHDDSNLITLPFSVEKPVSANTSTVAPPPPRHIRPVRRRQVSLAQRGIVEGRAFVPSQGNPSSAYRLAKRGLDLIGAVVLLAVLGPAMLAVFLVLLVTTRRKPLFCQKRLGYGGRPFTMLKFRTMALDAEQRRDDVVNEKDGPIFKNRADARITRLGRLLRKTSLDETPQLFNVLAGHMSLVGPRPPIDSEVAQYQPWQRRRLAVKPGLTCLWQVSGRSEIEFEDWVRMDLWYVKNQNWKTDLRLLVRTPWTVLTGRGAY